MLFEKVRYLLGVRRGLREAPALRPLVNEVATAWPFTEAAVDISPAAPGVYLLYKHGRLIYIGAAVNGLGIRAELESHRCGARSGCTQAATAFLFEVCAEPLRLQRRYLDEHRALHGGRAPACNERGLGG
jgi:hypothetical protein